MKEGLKQQQNVFRQIAINDIRNDLHTTFFYPYCLTIAYLWHTFYSLLRD